MSKIRIILAQNMKNYRKILGLSQMDLAEKIGCSPTLIGKIETMKRFPSAENFDRISEALEITLADLLNDSNNKAMKVKAAHQKRKEQLKSKILQVIDESF